MQLSGIVGIVGSGGDFDITAEMAVRPVVDHIVPRADGLLVFAQVEVCSLTDLQVGKTDQGIIGLRGTAPGAASGAVCIVRLIGQRRVVRILIHLNIKQITIGHLEWIGKLVLDSDDNDVVILIILKFTVVEGICTFHTHPVRIHLIVIGIRSAGKGQDLPLGECCSGVSQGHTQAEIQLHIIQVEKRILPAIPVGICQGNSTRQRKHRRRGAFYCVTKKSHLPKLAAHIFQAKEAGHGVLLTLHLPHRAAVHVRTGQGGGRVARHQPAIAAQAKLTSNQIPGADKRSTLGISGLGSRANFQIGLDGDILGADMTTVLHAHGEGFQAFADLQGALCPGNTQIVAGADIGRGN